jgi:isoquinoline 1-oxidoreductase beta subunit
MSAIPQLRRREFLKTTAAACGGLIIGLHLPKLGAAQEGAAPKLKPFPPNAFVRIGSDESVTVIVNHSEMGQGVYTSLPMLLAEELEADWKKIRVEAAPVDAVYNHTIYGVQMTGGSSTDSSEWVRFRLAGAMARQMLISAAAQQWQVDPAGCRARKGFVMHDASGRRASFGSLAVAAAQLPAPQDVALKEAKDFEIIGKPTHRLDTRAKSNGTAEFGLDVRRPGMLTAVVLRSPVYGGKVRSFNAEKARGVAGVKYVVEVPSGVAVIADGFWPAKLGREKLEVVWDEGENASLSTAGMRAQYAALAKTPGATAKHVGDPAGALAGAAKTITAEYEVPYLAHCMMEPLNCVVELHDDHCDIWAGSQFQTVDRLQAAKTAGLPPEKVSLTTTFLGGGFGRRANPASDYIVEAVEVAKAVRGAKAPVRVVWTREDDIRGLWYRPMWYDRFVAGFDRSGTPIAWTHTIVGQSIMAGTAFAAFAIQNGVDSTSVEGAADLHYGVPNLHVDLHTTTNGVPVQWWRSVGHSHNGFSVEGFFDEVAHAAGKDPVELRRSLLTKEPRMRGVVDLVAEKSGWGQPLPAGRARGIATHFSFDTYVAQVAEVSVEKDGTVRVHRVTCAVDCGQVINPDTVIAQMEGGIIFGLTAALKTEITLDAGKVQQRNFHDYQMIRMFESPAIDVHIVPSTAPPTGVGEPSVPPVASAVANAIFAATGKRLRRLPIKAEDLRSA